MINLSAASPISLTTSKDLIFKARTTSAASFVSHFVIRPGEAFIPGFFISRISANQVFDERLKRKVQPIDTFPKVVAGIGRLLIRGFCMDDMLNQNGFWKISLSPEDVGERQRREYGSYGRYGCEVQALEDAIRVTCPDGSKAPANVKKRGSQEGGKAQLVVRNDCMFFSNLFKRDRCLSVLRQGMPSQSSDKINELAVTQAAHSRHIHGNQGNIKELLAKQAAQKKNIDELSEKIHEIVSLQGAHSRHIHGNQGSIKELLGNQTAQMKNFDEYRENIKETIDRQASRLEVVERMYNEVIPRSTSMDFKAIQAAIAEEKKSEANLWRQVSVLWACTAVAGTTVGLLLGKIASIRRQLLAQEQRLAALEKRPINLDQVSNEQFANFLERLAKQKSD